VDIGHALARRSDSENAVMAIGTSWMFSVRFFGRDDDFFERPCVGTTGVCEKAASGSMALIAPTTDNALRFMDRPLELSSVFRCPVCR